MVSMAYSQATATIRDEDLASAAKGGDQGAYTRLMERYRRPVTAFIAGRIRNVSDAEDLAQETFVRAYQALDRYHPNKSWSAWLLTIARNACTDYQRRHAVRKQTELDEQLLPGVPGPERDVLENLENARLRTVVMALPEAQRVPLLMHYSGGCTYHEIADALKIPYSTVVGRLAGAMRSLRRKMGAEG